MYSQIEDYRSKPLSQQEPKLMDEAICTLLRAGCMLYTAIYRIGGHSQVGG